MTTPVFNVDKSLQAFLYIVNRLQKKDIHKIFKIMYFADREHLSKYGRPITGDTYIAMRDGPVPSKIGDIVKAVRGDSFFSFNADEYAKLFSIHNWYFVTPKAEANLDYLSQSDIEELDSSLKEYGSMSWGEVREKSHDFAWNVTSSNGQIRIDDILRENGEDESYIDYVTEHINLQKACL